MRFSCPQWTHNTVYANGLITTVNCPWQWAQATAHVGNSGVVGAAGATELKPRRMREVPVVPAGWRTVGFRFACWLGAGSPPTERRKRDVVAGGGGSIVARCVDDLKGAWTGFSGGIDPLWRRLISPVTGSRNPTMGEPSGVKSPCLRRDSGLPVGGVAGKNPLG